MIATVAILILLLTYVAQPLRRAPTKREGPYQPLARVTESVVRVQFGHFAGRATPNLCTVESLFLLRSSFLNNATQRWNGVESESNRRGVVLYPFTSTQASYKLYYQAIKRVKSEQIPCRHWVLSHRPNDIFFRKPAFDFAFSVG
jgi:hypothetical protein